MVLMGATSGSFLPSVPQCGAQDLKYYVWLRLAPLTEESQPSFSVEFEGLNLFPCLEVFLSSLFLCAVSLQSWTLKYLI